MGETDRGKRWERETEDRGKTDGGERIGEAEKGRERAAERRREKKEREKERRGERLRTDERKAAR